VTGYRERRILERCDHLGVDRVVVILFHSLGRCPLAKLRDTVIWGRDVWQTHLKACLCDADAEILS
jgi:hypothetical protein